MNPAGPRLPLVLCDALAMATRPGVRAAILVEGWSDEAAVVAAARLCEAPLAGRGVLVLPIGGITNLGKFARALAASGLRLSGLHDASEEHLAWRAIESAGLGAVPTRDTARKVGFFACDRDLEDELIRAVGAEGVERLLHAEDEIAAFRRFQKQPEHRGGDLHGQLRRFLGTRAGRKIRFGSLLVSALPPERVPAPLRGVLAHALA